MSTVAMRESVDAFGDDGVPVRFRIGLSSGPAVAGVIGTHKFAYDLWGDTVNTAARMGSHGVPGEIQLSRSTHDRLQHTHHTTARSAIDIKGKGHTETWLLGARIA
jgi:adenylate cyclase